MESRRRVICWLRGPAEDEVGDLLELRRPLRSCPAEGVPGLRVRLGCQGTGAVQAERAHVRQLAVSLVRSQGLPEVGFRSGHVEDVVDDLEQHAKLRSELAE